MQTATSETENKSLDLSICVHHYTLRAPCPKGQGKSTSDDIRGSDRSVYVDNSAYVNGQSLVLCRCMALCVTRGWGCEEFIVQDLHGCAFDCVFLAVADPLSHVPPDVSS